MEQNEVFEGENMEFDENEIEYVDKKAKGSKLSKKTKRILGITFGTALAFVSGMVYGSKKAKKNVNEACEDDEDELKTQEF